jgi:hypothetical protein
MRSRVSNFLLYQMAWAAGVLGAGQGWPLAGGLVALVVVALHVWRRPRWGRELLVVGVVSAVGWGVDTLQAVAGVFSFHGAGAAAWICPVWLIGVWAAFGTTLNSSLAWLHGRPWLSAACGACAGPLAYGAGARLGAVVPHPNPVWFLAELAGVWAVMTPALFVLAVRLSNRPGHLKHAPMS